MMAARPYDGLPDPTRESALYADIPLKRLIAWVIDGVFVAVLIAFILPFTFFTGLFFLPFLWLVVGFLYRWMTISGGSATWGMRLTAISLRDHNGQRLDGGTALLHTLGYTVSLAVFPLQLISIVLMLVSPRRQGLTDHILGTAAVNRAAES